MNKINKLPLLLLIAGLAIIGVIAAFNIMNKPSATESERLVSVEPFVHNGLAFELDGLSSEGTKHTFYFVVENVGDIPTDADTTFAIVNGDKCFTTSDVTYYNRDLNPGMSGRIYVTFEMNAEDLTEGSPVLEVDRGFLLKDAITVELVRN